MNNSNPPLTEAANQLLDLYLHETREELAFEAARIAASLSDLREVGVTEVLAAIQARDETRTGGLQSRKSYRYRRVALAYVVLGTAMAAGGLLLYLSDLLRRSALSEIQYSAIFIATLGVLITTVGAALSAITRARLSAPAPASREREPDEVLTGEFLFRWTRFERLLTQTAAERFGESTTTSRRGVVELLKKSKVLSDEDIDDYKNLQQMRNTIVHGVASDQPDDRAIDKALIILDGLIKKVTRD